MEEPQTWGGEKITPGDGQLISAPSSLPHHLPPQKIQGIAPTGGQSSAKFPLTDSKAANPAGCWHCPDTQSPCSSSSSKSLSWEVLGQQIPELGGFGKSSYHCRALSEPHRDGESLDCPSRASPGAPRTCSSSTQPRDLLSCTQTSPTLHVPARSPTRIPQNYPGIIIRAGFTQVFPIFSHSQT